MAIHVRTQESVLTRISQLYNLLRFEEDEKDRELLHQKDQAQDVPNLWQAIRRGDTELLHVQAWQCEDDIFLWLELHEGIRQTKGKQEASEVTT